MCSEPIQISPDVFVACRGCNECLGARITDWVDRAMAEKYTMGHALVFALTYRNVYNPKTDKYEPPLGARMFRYKDIKDFLKVVREAYFDKYGKRGEVRYLVCGEFGSKHGRAHWHMVVFSKRPLHVLGKWTDYANRPKEFSTGKANQHWSLWRHGFVSVQEPDQGGMAYALKYCIKDQFNVLKAKNTGRFTKSDRYGDGFFRMSKKPPIGYDFVLEFLQRCRDGQYVPPSLEIQIPDKRGYWFPKGKLREMLIHGLHEINETFRAANGYDLQTWSTLLRSVSLSEKDTEGLLYGQVDETEYIETQQSIAREQRQIDLQRAQLAAKARATEAREASYGVRRKCGRILPCIDCIRGKPVADIWRYYSEEHVYRTAWTIEQREKLTPKELASWSDQTWEHEYLNHVSRASVISTGCNKSNYAYVREAFAIGRIDNRLGAAHKRGKHGHHPEL